MAQLPIGDVKPKQEFVTYNELNLILVKPGLIGPGGHLVLSYAWGIYLTGQISFN